MAQKGKKESKIVWQDEIKRLEIVAIDQLLANPKNWKTHSKTAREALEGSLDELGIIKPLIINLRTDAAWPPEDRGIDVMLDGHRRVLVSMERGQPTWPAIFVDLPPAKEAKALLILDELTRLHGADKMLLDSLLREVHTPNLALMQMLDTLAQEHGIVPPESGAPDEAPEPQLDRAEKLRREWGVELGQLWTCGAHRVLCGDCTDAEDVARLMLDEQATLVITDPPYGVSYADKNAFLNTIGPANRIETPIVNDHLSKSDMQALWKTAFSLMAIHMAPGAVVYCFMPQGGDQMMMMMMMEGAGIEPRHELIWVKNNHVLGRVDYAYKHEPILYAWKAGGHHFYGDFQTSLFEFPKPQKSALHPTTKPVELIARLVENSSLPDEVLYDGFLGAGTTLIAAEQLKRRCRGIEIDSGYVAVTLQRYYNLTGDRPKLLP